eukprot:1379899-Ditylum_brightwellii.AAC.1
MALTFLSRGYHLAIRQMLENEMISTPLVDICALSTPTLSVVAGDVPVSSTHMVVEVIRSDGSDTSIQL